ncbi:MAG: PQQ-like beta-propeller repeat protein [Bacteroidaceae bacterium]|nr:PQQ-like beta-propeller repeat protein [Bacteroidaceae bacterium]
MTRTYLSLTAAALLGLVLLGCGGERSAQPQAGSDGQDAETNAMLQPFPDTAYPSAESLQYEVEILDTATDGTLADLSDPYADKPGHFTFRGGQQRDEPMPGSVRGEPTRIVRDWTFHTAADNTHTATGTWGGGSGWTGQPVYVNWAEANTQSEQTPRGGQEIIVGSLCGQVYFIDYTTGQASRPPLNAGNPVKGSVSLDPSLSGALYVGQGIPAHPPIGHQAFDIDKAERTFFYGPDPKAQRGWGAFDSSPIAAGQFLFWPGENGTIYKYIRTPDGPPRIHTKLRYHVRGMGAAGVESSMAVCRNYGYFGDNHGNIVCINLNNMRPVWRYDNHDDIDATIVCEIDTATSVPYIYAGCEVDRQGSHGNCHIVKLNGMNGEQIWEAQIPCNQLKTGDKHFDGGLYGTPLLGHGDCEEMLFASICQPGDSKHAVFMAINRATGEIIYRTPLDFFAWSSPVPFYNEHGTLYIVTADSAGRLYLIRAKTGEIIYKEVLGNNFESTPVPVGNTLVVGSRGQEIHRFHIE